MNNLLFCLNATVPVFLVMMAGYILRCMKMLDESFINKLNHLNFKVTLPILLMMDIASTDFYQVMDFRFVLFCFLVTLGSILGITVFAILFIKKKSILGEFIQASYRGSAAVLGIAFVQNIYGSTSVAPLMVFATVPLYNVMAVVILLFAVPHNHIKKKSEMIKESLIEIIQNPIIVGITIGMILSLVKFKIPYVMDKTLQNFSVLATPLALIGLGAGFEGKKVAGQLAPTILSGMIKLVVLPAIFLPLAVKLGFADEKLIAILIMLGAPTTVSAYIMARNTGYEGVLSSSCIVFSTFLSSITISFWLFVLKLKGVV